MSFCRSLCGMSPKISQQIDRKLKEVVSIYPTTTCLILLSRDGQLIAQTDNPQLALPDELHAPIASLKKTALELCGALNSSDCTLIRLRGHTHTFCCYDVDRSLLALYCVRSGVDGAEEWDDADKDKRMVGILQELRLLIVNLHS